MNVRIPPVNVAGYYKLGLIPNFSYLINNGLWVKKPRNNGNCNTIVGMKYITTGSYLENKYFEPQNKRPCYYYDIKEKYTSFPVAANLYYKRHNKKFVGGIFGFVPVNSLLWSKVLLFLVGFFVYGLQ